jgi:hypothetical protein
MPRHGGNHWSEDDEHDRNPLNSSLPTIKPGAPLNRTSAVTENIWTRSYNDLKGFEANEIGHSIYT